MNAPRPGYPMKTVVALAGISGLSLVIAVLALVNASREPTVAPTPAVPPAVEAWMDTTTKALNQTSADMRRHEGSLNAIEAENRRRDAAAARHDQAIAGLANELDAALRAKKEVVPAPPGKNADTLAQIDKLEKERERRLLLLPQLQKALESGIAEANGSAGRNTAKMNQAVKDINENQKRIAEIENLVFELRKKL